MGTRQAAQPRARLPGLPGLLLLCLVALRPFPAGGTPRAQQAQTAPASAAKTGARRGLAMHGVSHVRKSGAPKKLRVRKTQEAGSGTDTPKGPGVGRELYTRGSLKLHSGHRRSQGHQGGILKRLRPRKTEETGPQAQQARTALASAAKARTRRGLARRLRSGMHKRHSHVRRTSVHKRLRPFKPEETPAASGAQAAVSKGVAKRVLRMKTQGMARRLEGTPDGDEDGSELAGAKNRGKGHAGVGWPGAANAGPIKYHGGPVMAGSPLTVYLIFYGSWTGQEGEGVLGDFVTSLSDAQADGQAVPSVREWWATSTEYTQKDGSSVSAEVKLGKTVFVNQGFKTSLGDSDVEQVVKDQVASGALPKDPNGFYAVITSKEIHEGSQQSGFCSVYCGWHSSTTQGDTNLVYAFVGDPTQQCDNGCGSAASVGDTSSPNGFYGIDSLISTFAHELTEAATNPDTSTGWFATDAGGQGEEEDGDLCAWTFTDDQHPKLAQNQAKGYSYNLVGVDGKRYLVQATADKDTQACAVASDTSSGAQPPTDIGATPPAGFGAQSPTDFGTPVSGPVSGASGPSGGASSPGGYAPDYAPDSRNFGPSPGGGDYGGYAPGSGAGAPVGSGREEEGEPSHTSKRLLVEASREQGNAG